MDFEEWKDFYTKKTGEPFTEDPGFITYILPNRGFCQYAVNPRTNRLAICHCVGDGKFWRDLGKVMLMQHGLDAIETLVCRNPKAYFRAMRFTIEDEEQLEKGRVNLAGRDEEGNRVTMDYGWVHPQTGKDVYVLVYFYGREGV
jgi:hypothetical protein